MNEPNCKNGELHRIALEWEGVCIACESAEARWLAMQQIRAELGLPVKLDS